MTYLNIPQSNIVGRCFNNCDSHSNGETLLLRHLLNQKIIFDVGCRSESIYANYAGEVHYFDPNIEHIHKLRLVETVNTKSLYNEFGLSSITGAIEYYAAYESFHNRSKSVSLPSEKSYLQVIKPIDYIRNNEIERIHLLKIDVEGHELEVIRGFEDAIKIVDIVQFEYGGTYLDAGITLKEIVEFLLNKGFDEFCYLSPDGLVSIYDVDPQIRDHYHYSNIVCFSKQGISSL